MKRDTKGLAAFALQRPTPRLTSLGRTGIAIALCLYGLRGTVKGQRIPKAVIFVSPHFGGAVMLECPTSSDSARSESCASNQTVYPREMTSTPAALAESGGCPVQHGRGGSDSAAKLKPDNLMYGSEVLQVPPEAANLSAGRVHSSIPRADTAETWVYPSERMFYNAMRRKGFEANPDDMRTVVAMHNVGIWWSSQRF